jgi:hypothetical protein
MDYLAQKLSNSADEDIKTLENRMKKALEPQELQKKSLPTLFTLEALPFACHSMIAWLRHH